MSKTVEQTSVETRIRQLTALAGFITSVLAGLSFEMVQYWLKHKTLLRQKLQEVFEIPADTYTELRLEWQDFWRDHGGLTVDFSGVHIPSKPNYACRLIGVAKGATLNATIVAMRKKFKIVLYVYEEDLDAVVPTNTRTTAESYFIWVRVGLEPDTEFLGKSTREADMDGKLGETLLERLVHGFKVFVETGKHLDSKGLTLCTGSRDLDGGVPAVSFDPSGDEVGVYWYGVDVSDQRDGLRQAVSL